VSQKVNQDVCHAPVLGWRNAPRRMRYGPVHPSALCEPMQLREDMHLGQWKRESGEMF
jgi:hypothetical protein